jgi:hypothetical protein
MRVWVDGTRSNRETLRKEAGRINARRLHSVEAFFRKASAKEPARPKGGFVKIRSAPFEGVSK